MNSRISSSRPRASPKATTSLKPKASSSSIRSAARGKSPIKTSTDLNGHDSQPTPAPLSIRDAIALKRAEAKKSKDTKIAGNGLADLDTLEDALPTAAQSHDEEDILGRGTLREVIERGKSTGSVNLAARSLPCIPSGLFELHLGITPDRLKSVPQEPPFPSAESQTPSRRGGRDVPAWYDSKDLLVLKVPNNDIQEIQHEISMFGSLKTVDLHKNKIVSIPDTFADLTMLTHLDLSYNALTALPKNVFALPELVNLNISHNELTSLPFSSPFVNAAGSRSRPNQSTGSFFMPTITRATSPLPRLTTLDASHNQILGDAIDFSLPSGIVKLDLSSNPLSSVKPDFLNAVAALGKLKELRLEKAGVTNAVFPKDPLTASSFPSLRLIDFGETQVTVDAAQSAFGGLRKQLSFEITREEPPEDTLQVVVGKRVIREAWEIEVEQRARPKVKIQGLTDNKAFLTPDPTVEVVKEAWEIEAEHGLLTEGGRRRARAAAAVVEADKLPDTGRQVAKPSSPSSPSKSSASVLNNAQYYNPSSQTLTLPPSFPPTKSPGHSRAFSAAFSSSPRPLASSSRNSDVLVPASTLPLSVIAPLPLARTLKVLVLNKRRLDRSFDIPVGDGLEPCLPCLEELSIAGCDLEDTVQVIRSDADTRSAMPTRCSEPLLPLIAGLFPSLRILDLSYNSLTDASLTSDSLSHLLLSDPSTNPPRRGLSHLRLQGNKISDLNGLTKIAEQFKGNRDVPAWKVEELDVRDNELTKLAPELGLLPLDVFLVDGNLFRVPQRRVWEREGTKGLLSWLRGRID